MDKEYSKIIVNRILLLCKNRHITINTLATMSGVSQSTLDNLINGRTFNPRTKTLHKIAMAFSMTLSEFLDFKELNDYCFDDNSDDEIMEDDNIR
ncbi:MAG TPA: helix-turn-helix domain-containing protein [Firmicutes bacterium]|nr:helix-turn-helix domain-containing protein [Bacillota bacterium]